MVRERGRSIIHENKVLMVMKVRREGVECVSVVMKSTVVSCGIGATCWVRICSCR